MMPAETFYILDAHSMAHRAYHAPFRPLTGPDGEPTKVPFLFTKQLLTLIKIHRPSYLAICWDSNRKTLRRRAIDPAYKVSAHGPNLELGVQLKRTKEITHLLGYANFEADGYEADDLIYTLARRHVSDDVDVRVVTRDKDLACLTADPRIKLYDHFEQCELGPEWVKRRFGVRPDQMGDFLALVGDAADGIPGVYGIGPKTAGKLLEGYKSVDGLIAALGSGKNSLTSAVYETLRTALTCGSLDRARRLIALESVPIRSDPESLVCKEPNLKAASPVFRALGFRQWNGVV